MHLKISKKRMIWNINRVFQKISYLMLQKLFSEIKWNITITCLVINIFEVSLFISQGTIFIYLFLLACQNDLCNTWIWGQFCFHFSPQNHFIVLVTSWGSLLQLLCLLCLLCQFLYFFMTTLCYFICCDLLQHCSFHPVVHRE